MTASRWVAGQVARWLVATAVVVVVLIGGVDAIERSRLLGDGGAVLDLLRLVAWRLPGLARELVPVWVALGTALGVGWMVRSGAWEALEGAGVAPRRSVLVVLTLAATVGGTTAALLEVVTPRAAAEAAAAEGALTGRPARLAGSWVRLGELAFRVGAASPGKLLDVTVLRAPHGRLERLEASEVRWDGQRWRGEVTVAATGPEPVADLDTLPLPPPQQVEALVRPRATAEAGLMVLGRMPLPSARAWWHRRMSGLLAPGIVALLAIGLGSRRRLGVAGAAGVAAVAAGALHLAVAVGTEALGPVAVWSGWGLAALVGAYLTASR